MKAIQSGLVLSFIALVLIGCSSRDTGVRVTAEKPAAPVVPPGRSRTRRLGLGAAPQVAKQLEGHCVTPRQKGTLAAGYKTLALWAHAHGSCELFDRYLTLFTQAGGSPSEEAQWRKNMAAQCPPPTTPQDAVVP